MSDVATLKPRGSKRHFDEMAIDSAPQVCSPARFPLRTPPFKRSRCAHPAVAALRIPKALPNPASSASSSSSSSSSPLHLSSTTPAPTLTTNSSPKLPSNPTPPSTNSHPSSSTAPPSAAKCILSPDELAALSRHIPRHLKRVIDRLASGDVALSERLFTLPDLREIVQSVLAEHESKLTAQFTATLNDRLAEQFRDFTKFNEDYVARKLRGTDVPYLS